MLRAGTAVAASGALVLCTALGATASTRWTTPPYYFKASSNGHVYGLQSGSVGKKKTCLTWDNEASGDPCEFFASKTWDTRLIRSDGSVISVTRTDLWQGEYIEHALQHEMWKHKLANRVPSLAWMRQIIKTAKASTDQQAHNLDKAIPDGEWFGIGTPKR